MTDETFSELVNLYLDEEIGPADLELLKAALSRDASRQADFHERCRLHQAMRLVLNPGGCADGLGLGLGAEVSGRLAATSPATMPPPSVPAGGRSMAFSLWCVGSAMAACLVLGAVVVSLVLMERTHVAAYGLVVGAENRGLDLNSGVARSNLKQFARTREAPGGRSGQTNASLAAQLRLLGLRPEMLPAERDLHEVSLASLEAREPTQRQVELFKGNVGTSPMTSPMPSPRFLKSYESRSASAPQWPSGFKSSLASFK